MTEATGGSQLTRSIRAREYLALGFGTIIGVGWVIVLGDWLGHAGPFGAMLAFAAGGVAMMLVGFCYAELATTLPVAGGEMAYAYRIFGLRMAYAIAWILALVFIAFTSFEAVALGWLVGTLLPWIEGPVLYVSRGEPVHLGGLALGLLGMGVITWVNYRGIHAAVGLQKAFIYAFVGICLVFIVAGVAGGDAANLQPLFQWQGTRSVFLGTLAVFITTPVWFAGFSVIPQAMEERAATTSLASVGRVIVLSIALAGVFYCLVIFSAAMATPWQDVLPMDLPAAGAFEAALGPWFANLVIIAAILGVLTTWNAVFIAATRLLFALGRADIILPRLGRLRPGLGAPSNAIAFVAAVGTAGVFLGRAAILPIINVGAACFAFAFLMTCIGVIKLRRDHPEAPRPYKVPGGVVTAGLAAAVTLMMLFMTLYEPYLAADGRVPLEWILLGAWGVVGLGFWSLARRARSRISEEERATRIFGALGEEPASTADAERVVGGRA